MMSQIAYRFPVPLMHKVQKGSVDEQQNVDHA